MSAFTSLNGEVTYVDSEIPTLSYVSIRPPSVSTTSRNYEDNTFIDWSTESVHAPTNSAYQTQKWITVILLSISVGYIATFIDFTSVWMNDLKKGVCLSRVDTWSLLNPYLTCPAENWYDWSRLIFNSTGFISKWVVNFPIYFVVALVWAMAAAYITIAREPLIKHSGIPEIKLIISGFNYKISQYLGVRTLVYKILGLILVVSSGLWLGKEGPLVHVSCCILNTIYGIIIGKNHFDNEAVRRELLSAATATGISVAFNAPIGGVLFVLETMPSFFNPTKIMWNSFVTATIAVVVLSGFKIFTDGENFFEKDLFQVLFGNFSWLFLEVIPFLILGVLGGVYGWLLIKFHAKFSSTKFRSMVQAHLMNIFHVTKPEYGKYLEILLVLIVTTLLNFPLEITRLPLNAYLKIMFTDCPEEIPESSNSINFMCLSSNGVTALKLAFVIVQGFFLSAYTFGIDLPGGILMPSLVLGASTGRLVGIISQWVQNFIDLESLATCTEKSCKVSPSSYAVVGAAAFMTGVTKLTMSVVVIIFELTGAITYVLPIMLSVMALKFSNDWLCHENIYDTWLKNSFNKHSSDEGVTNGGKGNGLVNFTGLTQTFKNQLPSLTVSLLMVPVLNTKTLSLLPEEPHTFSSLYKFMDDDSHEGYPLVLSSTNPISLGYVYKHVLYANLAIVGNHEVPISFQLSNASNAILSQQLHYEQSFPGILQIDLQPEYLQIIFFDSTPVITIMESFEKLHLNYSIIVTKGDSSVMSGFIDRYIITNLIDEGFESLDQSVVRRSLFDFDDLETALLEPRRERSSVELIT